MNKVETFLSNLQLKIRDLAFVIDTLVSLFTGMPFGKLYYRNLEKEKILALKGKKRIIMLNFINLEKVQQMNFSGG